MKRTQAPGPRYDALLQLLRTAEALWNASRVFFGRWDLGPSQFNILNLLHDRHEGLTQTELSRALIMHRSNVTGLVDRLEERRLVRRRESAKDARAWRVVITPAGRRLVARILPHYHAAADRVWRGVPASRAAQLLADLAQLGDNSMEAAKPE